MQALGGNGRKTRVCVAENQQRVRLDFGHELVRAVDDVANGRAEVVSHGVHIHLGVGKFEVLEEHAVEVVVVVLTGVGEDYVEVLAALVDSRSQSDNLGGACPRLSAVSACRCRQTLCLYSR